MLDPQPMAVQRLVDHLLRQRQLLAAWFLGRHEDLDLGERERQEAQLLQEPAPRGQGIGRRVGNALSMDTASTGVTEEEDREEGIDQQDIFDRVVLFLAAITPGLFSRVLGRTMHRSVPSWAKGRGWCYGWSGGHGYWLLKRGDHSGHLGLRNA